MNELHDAVEQAIDHLNTQMDLGRGGDDAELALAVLNRVL